MRAEKGRCFLHMEKPLKTGKGMIIMAFYGKEIIDWAIRDAQTKHKGEIALIVGDRFANKTPGDGDCTTLQFFVPKTAAGEKAAMAFTVEGVGYDYFAIPWERLESIAALRDTITFVLAEGQVLWAESEAEKRRFYALRETLFRNLADMSYVCRIVAKRLDEAMQLYARMAFEESLGALRMGARFLSQSLGESIAAVNGTYLKRGGIGTDDPTPLLETLETVPAGYIGLQKRLYSAKTAGEILSVCHDMIAVVRKFLAGLLPPSGEPVPAPEALEGWYEELSYTWRRIAYFCAQGDARNAFSWAGYLQADIGMLGGLVTEEERDLLGAFDENDLHAFAARCGAARVRIREKLAAHGVRLREYGSLADFLRENGEDEI